MRNEGVLLDRRRELRATRQGRGAGASFDRWTFRFQRRAPGPRPDTTATMEGLHGDRRTYPVQERRERKNKKSDGDSWSWVKVYARSVQLIPTHCSSSTMISLSSFVRFPSR